MSLVVLVIEEEQAPIEHDWVVLLRDLVSCRQVSVNIVLSIELDLTQDAPAESERCFDREVEAALVKHRQHAWQAKVNKVCMCVWLSDT